MYILNGCDHAYDSCRVGRLEETYGDSPGKAELAEMMGITEVCYACHC